jgi:hypothetical protein
LEAVLEIESMKAADKTRLVIARPKAVAIQTVFGMTEPQHELPRRAARAMTRRKNWLGARTSLKVFSKQLLQPAQPDR